MDVNTRERKRRRGGEGEEKRVLLKPFEN